MIFVFFFLFELDDVSVPEGQQQGITVQSFHGCSIQKKSLQAGTWHSQLPIHFTSDKASLTVFGTVCHGTICKITKAQCSFLSKEVIFLIFLSLLVFKFAYLYTNAYLRFRV